MQITLDGIHSGSSHHDLLHLSPLAWYRNLQVTHGYALFSSTTILAAATTSTPATPTTGSQSTPAEHAELRPGIHMSGDGPAFDPIKFYAMQQQLLEQSTQTRQLLLQQAEQNRKLSELLAQQQAAHSRDLQEIREVVVARNQSGGVTVSDGASGRSQSVPRTPISDRSSHSG